MRFVDNLCVFCVILLISVQEIGSIECEIDFFCNNTDNKYASHNPYVRNLLIIGAAALVFEIFIYAFLYFQHLVVREMQIEDADATMSKSRHGNKLPKDQLLLVRFHPRFLKIALKDREKRKRQ